MENDKIKNKTEFEERIEEILSSDSSESLTKNYMKNGHTFYSASTSFYSSNEYNQEYICDIANLNDFDPLDTFEDGTKLTGVGDIIKSNNNHMDVDKPMNVNKNEEGAFVANTMNTINTIDNKTKLANIDDIVESNNGHMNECKLVKFKENKGGALVTDPKDTIDTFKEKQN